MVNKRRGEPAVPGNYESLLTPEQLEALKRLETFGWSLHIVRRPKFEPVEVVLEHSDGKFSLLNEQGELDHDHPLSMRREEVIVDTGEDTDGDPWANATDDAGFELREPEIPDASPTTVSNEPVPARGSGGKRPPKVIV
jgi:hypothetical protein